MVGDLNPGIVCMEADTRQSKQSTEVELFDARPSGLREMTWHLVFLGREKPASY